MNATHIPIMSAVFLLCACGSGEDNYDASGIFETTEVIVSARGGGEIVRLEAEEGMEVVPGAFLGHIDTTQLALKRQQLIANLSATDSRQLDENRQLAALRQQLANLQTEQARFEKLVKANAATQKQLDDIGYQIEVVEKQLAANAEQVDSSNNSLTGQSASIMAQVAQIDDQIADCVISSPIRGKVLSKYAEQGEYVAQGRALLKVGNVEEMKLRAYITASQLTTIHLGQTVSVYADLGEDGRREYEGTVTWLSDEAEFTPKTIQTRDERSNLVYAIKVLVRNDGTIKRGMYGDVKFWPRSVL